MKCAACQNVGSAVVDSRVNGMGRRRRHVCDMCGHRYTTLEVNVEDLRTMLSGQGTDQLLTLVLGELASLQSRILSHRARRLPLPEMPDEVGSVLALKAEVNDVLEVGGA